MEVITLKSTAFVPPPTAIWLTGKKPGAADCAGGNIPYRAGDEDCQLIAFPFDERWTCFGARIGKRPLVVIGCRR
jgi:hypothetical protein